MQHLREWACGLVELKESAHAQKIRAKIKK